MTNFVPSDLMRTVTLGALMLAFTGPVLAAPDPFTLVTATPKTLTSAAIAAAQRAETHGQVSSSKKTLAFHQKVVRLVAVTGPDNDMLSYRIDGLRNPTLIVPKRATLRVLFVNTDDDMAHNIRFGMIEKSYPNVMNAYLKNSVGAPPLPHKTRTTFTGQELTLHAPATPGTYAYLCTVRGHAQGGMVGTVIVR
jgi:rusticyanin